MHSGWRGGIVVDSQLAVFVICTAVNLAFAPEIKRIFSAKKIERVPARVSDVYAEIERVFPSEKIETVRAGGHHIYTVRKMYQSCPAASVNARRTAQSMSIVPWPIAAAKVVIFGFDDMFATVLVMVMPR